MEKEKWLYLSVTLVEEEGQLRAFSTSLIQQVFTPASGSFIGEAKQLGFCFQKQHFKALIFSKHLALSQAQNVADIFGFQKFLMKN